MNSALYVAVLAVAIERFPWMLLSGVGAGEAPTEAATETVEAEAATEAAEAATEAAAEPGAARAILRVNAHIDICFRKGNR